MARIEKTVFISYRRTDVYTALAVYENLKNQGYDVFFDYRSISSGDFEQIITSNIRARAHFILILTPTALDRCNEPGDWLRREIELAIDEKRNIVPLFFKGFRFGVPSVTEKLTGKLKNISRYNGLNVHEDYFEEAMQRVREQFLSKPLDTVLHPVSTEVRKIVREEQIAADEALEKTSNKTFGNGQDLFEFLMNLIDQLESNDVNSSHVAKFQLQGFTTSDNPIHIQEIAKSALSKWLERKALQFEVRGDFWNARETYFQIKRIAPDFPRVNIKIQELEKELQPKSDTSNSRPAERKSADRLASAKTFPYRLVMGLAGGLLIIVLFIWGGISLWHNDSSTPTPDLFATLGASTPFFLPTPTPKPKQVTEAGSGDEAAFDFAWADTAGSSTNACYYRLDVEVVIKSYPSPIYCLVVNFNYSAMTNGERVRGVWYLNGSVFADSSFVWEDDAEGDYFIYTTNYREVMPPGEYYLEVYAGEENRLIGTSDTITVEEE